MPGGSKNSGANASDPIAADAADWDGDGLFNLTEYFLDLAPKTPDRDALPVPFQEGDYLYFSFVPNPAALDIIYAVEAATALGGWSTADVEPVTLPNPNPPNRVTVRYPASDQPDGSHFPPTQRRATVERARYFVSRRAIIRCTSSAMFCARAIISSASRG
jgi:hypothetical protein